MPTARRIGVLACFAASIGWAQVPPEDPHFSTWQPRRDDARWYPPTVGVFNGARYVLDSDDGPIPLDSDAKALPTRGLVFGPLIEGPLGHKPNPLFAGQLTYLRGDTRTAVAVVASKHNVIIQDAYLWRSGGWRLWLHSYSGRPGAEVFDFQFDGTGGVLALLGNEAGYELAQSRPGLVRRPAVGVDPCTTHVRAVGFALRPSGELFVAGTDCEHPRKGALIERWKPGSAASEVMNLETSEPLRLMAMASNAREVVVGGCVREREPFLASVSSDGSSLDAAPDTPGCVESIALSRGSTWAIIKGQVWQRPNHEAWRLVQTPNPWPEPALALQVQVVAVFGHEELWVTLEHQLAPNLRPHRVAYALVHARLSEPE